MLYDFELPAPPTLTTILLVQSAVLVNNDVIDMSLFIVVPAIEGSD